MDRNRALSPLFALLLIGLAGSGCVHDRMVDIVANGEIIVPFVVQVDESAWSLSQVVDLGSAADIDAILRDNDLEPGTVRARLESLSFRVTRADPARDRTISGTMSVSDSQFVRFTGVLVDDPVNADWVSVPLEKPGTDVINSALDAYIASQTSADLMLHTEGTSTPADVPADFAWEVRVKIGIVGKMKISIFEPF